MPETLIDGSQDAQTFVDYLGRSAPVATTDPAALPSGGAPPAASGAPSFPGASGPGPAAARAAGGAAATGAIEGGARGDAGSEPAARALQSLGATKTDIQKALQALGLAEKFGKIVDRLLPGDPTAGARDEVAFQAQRAGERLPGGALEAGISPEEFAALRDVLGPLDATQAAALTPADWANLKGLVASERLTEATLTDAPNVVSTRGSDLPGLPAGIRRLNYGVGPDAVLPPTGSPIPGSGTFSPDEAGGISADAFVGAGEAFVPGATEATLANLSQVLASGASGTGSLVGAAISALLHGTGAAPDKGMDFTLSMLGGPVGVAAFMLSNLLTDAFTNPGNFKQHRAASAEILPEVLPRALEDLVLAGTYDDALKVLGGLDRQFPLHYDPEGRRITGGYEAGVDLPVGELLDFYRRGGTFPNDVTRRIKEQRLVRDMDSISGGYGNLFRRRQTPEEALRGVEGLSRARFGGAEATHADAIAEEAARGAYTNYERLVGTGMDPEQALREALAGATGDDFGIARRRIAGETTMQDRDRLALQGATVRAGGVTPENVAALANVDLDTARGIIDSARPVNQAALRDAWASGAALPGTRWTAPDEARTAEGGAPGPGMGDGDPGEGSAAGEGDGGSGSA